MGFYDKTFGSFAGTCESVIEKPHIRVFPVSEVGLRFYSTKLSRWANRDPIGDFSFCFFQAEALQKEPRLEIERFERELQKVYTYLESEGLSQIIDRIKREWQQDMLEIDALLFISNNSKPAYRYVNNSSVNYYDVLGLDHYADVMRCRDRCDKLPLNYEALKKCYMKCDDNPCYIPTVEDLLTPPVIKPGWPNWLDWLKGIKNGIGKIKDKIKKR